MYHLNKTLKDGNTYWECNKRLGGIGCKTKAVLNQQNKFLRQSGEHIHAPDPDKVLSASRSAIKRAAIETNASMILTFHPKYFELFYLPSKSTTQSYNGRNFQ